MDKEQSDCLQAALFLDGLMGRMPVSQKNVDFSDEHCEWKYTEYNECKTLIMERSK